MSERDDLYVGKDGPRLPRNTGEFRAAPDISASTAEFKAFAAGQASGTRPAADNGSWPEQPWDDGPATSGAGRTLWFVIGGIVLVALVVLLLIFA